MGFVDYAAVTSGDAPLAAQDWPARRVPVAGVDLLVRDTPGTAADLPPALFVHGLGGSSLNWTALGLLLNDTVRGIAVDLPGFGRTPPLPEPAGLRAHTRLLGRLMDTELDRPAHVFGNSMGGALAVALAARYPERVTSLTLISPALPHPRASLSAVWFAALSTPVLGKVMLERTKRMRFDLRLQAGLSMLFGEPGAVPDEVVRAYEAELHTRDAMPWGTQATLEAARSVLWSQLAPPRWSLWSEAAKIRCPVLLVYGGRDRLVAAKIRTKAQQAFHDARLLYLPKSGHVAQMEHPEHVERAFRQLIG
jgi:pimeloyl-ACP methyl ester carboxylesterase